MNFSRISHTILLIIFFFGLFLPGVGLFFRIGPFVYVTENRVLTLPPTYFLGSIRSEVWRKQFESYVNDHVGLRLLAVFWYNRLHLTVFGESPLEKVAIGKDGWLFYVAEGAAENYHGTNLFSSQELAFMAARVKSDADRLKEQGIAYLLVLVPEKQSIYGEFLDDGFGPLPTVRPYDQFVTYLHNHTDIPFLDTKSLLLKARREERVYHKTDTHWNDVGAYLAYEEIIRALGSPVPGVGASLLVTRSTSSTLGGDLSELLLQRQRTEEKKVFLTPITDRTLHSLPVTVRNPKPERPILAMGVGEKQLPVAIMFRDSFGEALIPWLSWHMQKMTFIWTPRIEYDIVDAEKPDIVIQEISERYISKLLEGISPSAN